MRKTKFEIGEYYHVFNRGTDKRIIFSDLKDLQRFFRSTREFNTINPIGSIHKNQFGKKKLRSLVSKCEGEKLVSFICYCLNPNHYHFILKPIVDKGIEKFMHKLGSGYTNYFNQKYKRDGSLFQGRYKAVHIDSDEYLLHLSAYINLNNRVHKFNNRLGNLVSKSSWEEYLGSGKDYCEKDIVLSQFSGVIEYRKFAKRALKDICEKKDIERLLLD